MSARAIAAYFDRDLAALTALGAPAAWLEVCEAHWAGDLGRAFEAGRAALAAGCISGREAAMLAAEVELLGVKLGRGLPPVEARERFAPAALIREYARYVHYFYVDHGMAWRALGRLLWLSVRVRSSRMLPTALFLVGHMLVMAAWTRTGFALAQHAFGSWIECRPPGPAGARFSDSLPFACFPYTVFIAGRFTLLEEVTRRCRARVPADAFYQCIFSASALYAAAYTGDVARAEVVAAHFEKAFAAGSMRRYKPVARIIPLLPLALRGYGHLVGADCRALVAGHDPTGYDAIVNSQFYRVATLVMISIADFAAARELARRAIAYREETRSFRAWRGVDLTIRDMADEKVPFDPGSIRLFGTSLRFDSPATLGMLLMEIIRAMPQAFAGGIEALERKICELIGAHLDCPYAELEDEPAGVAECVAQMRFGTRFLVVRGIDAERVPLVERFLATIAPVCVIVEQSVRELLELKLENEQVSRDAAVARTTQMLAHDVRRPFSMLRVALGALNAAVSADEVRRTAAVVLPEVERASASVDGLISDVLGVATEPALALELAPAGKLARACVAEAFSFFPEADVTFEWSVDSAARVRVDPAKLQRVFSNILANAIEAMGGRGRIWFRVAPHEEAGRNFVEFVIGNDGSSIAPEDVPLLFEAYFTRKKRNGTGLGLAIAKRIVTAHGGRIECAAPRGRGVEFRFTLPAAEPSATAAALELPAHARELVPPGGPEPGWPARSSAPASRPELALVDDSRAFLLGWRAQLGPHAQVHFFTSPESFWGALAEDGTLLGRLSLIITDYRFGNSPESGISFARALRARAPRLPIVLSSSGVVPEAETEGVVDRVIDKDRLDWKSIRPLIARSFPMVCSPPHGPTAHRLGSTTLEDDPCA